MSNAWEAILDQLRGAIAEEDFRRWFGATSYASDSGDQLTVWVSSEAIRRHLEQHYFRHIDRARAEIGRADTVVRFVVTGVEEEE
jgi:chromosomal replication initiation ATPase DnaA